MHYRLGDGRQCASNSSAWTGSPSRLRITRLLKYGGSRAGASVCGSTGSTRGKHASGRVSSRTTSSGFSQAPKRYVVRARVTLQRTGGALRLRSAKHTTSARPVGCLLALELLLG